MITVYGIKTCDTVRKALKWLTDKGIAHTFHDFRADGLEATTVQRWIDAKGWESVLNKRSATWGQLSDADKRGLDGARAKKLMVANPTLIKRPVFEGEDLFLQGFTDEVRQSIAAKHGKI
ncbi:arsenate reductase [Magnetovibrio blakemorei]|uniref:Arsenate reductase n=1 Tax=Magnetovibrio blakemorei TaxID=28181 RepID=A0A1E5Q6T2_9PROT|nr:arsenate reductase [Magnetovibrio blakemorei]OEJ65981.1 arsenate reductase [Magnetovibrio blakemorei]